MAEVPDEATACLSTIAPGLLKDRQQPPGSAIKRVRYFAGQLIEADGGAVENVIKVKNPKAPAATRALDGTF
jgi:hypothetical protein